MTTEQSLEALRDEIKSAPVLKPMGRPKGKLKPQDQAVARTTIGTVNDKVKASTLLATFGDDYTPSRAGAHFAIDEFKGNPTGIAYLANKLADSEFLDEFAEILRRGIRARDRTCMRIASDVLKSMGAAEDLASKLLGMLGVSLSVAKVAVEAHANAAPLVRDRRQMVQECESYLLREYQDDSALCWRSPLRRVLLNAQGQGEDVGGKGDNDERCT